MGLVATNSVTAGPIEALLSPVGVGFGSVFVAASAVVAIAYLDAVRASERTSRADRTAVLAVVVPLLATLAALGIYEALQTL